MSSTARLVVRPVPRQGESLLGFLLRAADANCYSGLAKLLRLANLPRTFVTRPCELRDLASLFGEAISPSQLEELSYWPVVPSDGVKFAGTTVSSVDINFIHPKVCPACLEEGGVARQVWDLRVVTTCWRHGCYLVDHCSECGSRLAWRRKRLLQCDCGSQFAKQPTDCAAQEAVAFALVLETLLISGDSWVDPFPMPVRTLGAICRVVWWFGAELVKLQNAQRIAIAKPRVCLGAKIVERGIYFLESWPRSIEELLDQLRAIGPKQQKRLVTSEHVLYRMRQTFGRSDFERMLDDVRRWLRACGYPVKPNSFYSIRQPRN